MTRVAFGFTGYYSKSESCTALNKTCEFELPDLLMYRKYTGNAKLTVPVFIADPTQHMSH